MRVLELFAGIGACSKALTNLGVEHEIVDAVEIDKFAMKAFNAIHGTNFEPQDITKWDKDIKCDLIMHGSPCQDFSVAGKQAGGDKDSGTRSSLMYETLRIVEKLRPKYVIWENVKNIISHKHWHNFANYQERMVDLGYVNTWKVVNAKDYGIPQNRERVFTVSIREDKNWASFYFPEPIKLEKRLKDVLEDNVDEKYYLSDEKIAMISKWRCYEKPLEHTMNGDSICGTLTTRSGAECGGMKTVIEEPNLKTQLCNSLVKNGVVKGGEIVNHSYTNSNRRNTLEKYIETQNGITPTLTTRPDILGYVEKTPLRIRKLTPKECYRLMGFSDSDFEKASQVISNA